MFRPTVLLLSALTFAFGGLGKIEAGIIAVDLGTAAPPATLGPIPYKMTPFPNDARPNFTNVTSVPSPLGGTLGFSSSRTLYEVGTTWATWSNGYKGDVYYNGSTSMTLTLPADTGAFYFYVEPNLFNTFNFTATANDGTFLTLSANGAAGARGFGFFADPGQSILSITIKTNTDFAVGEFGIAKTIPAPEPTSLAVFGLATLAAGAYGWRRRKLAAA